MRIIMPFLMTQGDNESSDDSVEMLESTWVAGLRCPCVNGPQASCSGKETLTSCGPAGPTSRPSSQPDGAAALPLQIWDTGGQERFRSMVSTFYKGSDGCILAFDVTDLESFEALDTWRGDVLAKTIPMEPSYPMVVLGNKIDLADRQVPQEVAQGWCREKDIPYFEVSAKNDINVVQAFEMLASRALSRYRSVLENYLADSIKLSPEDQPRSRCC
uniref:RAB7B, member RAS onco family n=1 Tax=Ailuropoda melanoleuca TaxID=9646 RepID=A0A7N5KGQ7_AILME